MNPIAIITVLGALFAVIAIAVAALEARHR